MDKELQDIIANFDSQGKILVEGLRNSIKIFNYKGTSIAIKSFRVPILINGLIYHYFRKSKARRSFENAKYLIEKGIGTPAPIAFHEEYKFFLLRDSYYVCEHLIPDLVFKDVFGNENKYEMEEILKGLARFTFLLHENGIEFIDHSPGNTLIKKNQNGTYDYFLVDLNRMKFHKSMSFELRMNNFRRLTPSKEMIQIIAKEYALCYNKPYNIVVCEMLKRSEIFYKKFDSKKALKKKFMFWKR